MKKRFAVLIAALALCLFALAGCSEGMVYSTMRIYDDLSGTKTVVIRVFGDQEPLEGRDYTAGNNTSFMLTQGDALEDKLQEFCALDEVRINVSMGKTNKDSTYITMIFDFKSIEDYNAKAKIIAGKYADEWTDATLTETGDRVTVREAASNLPLLYLDMLEQYFNDFDCYPIYEYGPDTQSQTIPNGIQFAGDDLYSFTWWIVPTATKIVVGSEQSEDVYFDPAEDYEYREDLSDDFTEVTGTPDARPVIASIAVKEGIATEYETGAKFAGGKIVITYSDGTTEETSIRTDMMSGFDTATTGEKTVTVSYEGFETTFKVTVSEKEMPAPDDDEDEDKTDGDVPDTHGLPTWAILLIGFGGVVVVGGVTAIIMWRKKR